MLQRLVISVAFAALTSGCSKAPELEQAKRRIAQLEAELAAERARPPTAAVASAPVLPASAIAVVEAVTKNEPIGEQWQYAAREDPMTGGTTRHAYVLSSNTVNFSSPYSGEQHGRLSLRIDPRHGRDVIFSIEQGQLLCRSYEDCEVLIRFDEGKPERFSGVGPADNSTETVFIRNYDKFVAKLRKSKTIRISLNIYQQGAPIFEFNVSGFDHTKFAGKP